MPQADQPSGGIVRTPYHQWHWCTVPTCSLMLLCSWEFSLRSSEGGFTTYTNNKLLELLLHAWYAIVSGKSAVTTLAPLESWSRHSAQKSGVGSNVLDAPCTTGLLPTCTSVSETRQRKMEIFLCFSNRKVGAERPVSRAVQGGEGGPPPRSARGNCLVPNTRTRYHTPDAGHLVVHHHEISR